MGRSEEAVRGRLSDRIFGLAGAGMVAVAIILLLRSLFVGEPVSAAPPELSLLSPSAGAEVALPLEIRFRSEEPLSLMRGGWGAGGFHLHAQLGASELMPGATDVRRTQDGSYSWTIPQAAPGPTTLRLSWSTADHVVIPGSGTSPVPLSIR